jgi:hypothetical protein
MQLRSGRSDVDTSKDGPLTTQIIVSLSRGPGIQKLRSLSELCGLRVSVKTYVAPKGAGQAVPAIRPHAAKLRLSTPVRCLRGDSSIRLVPDPKAED